MKNKILKIIFPISVLFIISLLFTGCILETSDKSYSPQGTTLQPQNTISVSGSGNVSVAPDEVSVKLTVLTEESDSEEAVNKNNNITEEVINAIKGQDLEDAKIETTGFNLQPLYNYNDDKPPEIYAYRVTNTVEVTTTEIERVGDLMATAIDAGANDIGSLSFNLSDEAQREAKRNALAKATKDAREKAIAIANSLEVKIGQIYYINESGISYPGPFYIEEAVAEMEAPEGKGVSRPPVSPRELEVTANVEITFAFDE